MPLSIVSLLALGFVLGLKHALDADHLAAVSTIAGEQRSLFRSSLIGAFWGFGHTLALVVAGMLVILLRLEISEWLSKAFEFCVGLMLILLGLNALKKLVKARRIHMHAHEHDGHWHIHPHLHEPNDQNEPYMHHGLRLGARPFLIGLVHGMAGSGTLTLLIVATIPSAAVGILYLLIFGIGSVGGMMMMSTIFALPAKLTAARFVRANLALRGFAGFASVAFGVLDGLRNWFCESFVMVIHRARQDSDLGFASNHKSVVLFRFVYFSSLTVFAQTHPVGAAVGRLFREPV